MQTLATRSIRLPLTIQVGDRLRSNSHIHKAKQKVHNVQLVMEKTETGAPLHFVQIDTNHGSFTFRPDQHVAFPARPDGSTIVHDVDFPYIKNVYVGDTIPPYGGWPEELTPQLVLEHGLQVTDIQISDRYKGWIVSVQPVNGGPGHKQFVSLKEGLFYGDWWTDSLDNLQEDESRPALQVASGRYRNIETGEVVRFRQPGRRGASPKGFPVINPDGRKADKKKGITAQPEMRTADWDKFQYLDVHAPQNRHVKDPNK